MRAEIAHGTGFWLTMDIMVVEVVDSTEQERARAEAPITVLK
jgi:hypothetical protein